MLREIQHVRQIEGEGTRRWFTDSFFDLIVWYDQKGGLIGFQLCYDKLGQERSFPWRAGHGSQHEAVDAGESPGRAKMAPGMASRGAFPRARIATRFRGESTQIDPTIANLVLGVLAPHAGASAEPIPALHGATEKGR